MSLAELRDRFRRDILRLAARHGARNVRVFGSTARGGTKPTSDIDFLVDLEPGRSLLDQAGLLIDLEELLECKVDLVLDGGISPNMADQILAEAIPL